MILPADKYYLPVPIRHVIGAILPSGRIVSVLVVWIFANPDKLTPYLPPASLIFDSKRDAPVDAPADLKQWVFCTPEIAYNADGTRYWDRTTKDGPGDTYRLLAVEGLLMSQVGPWLEDDSDPDGGVWLSVHRDHGSPGPIIAGFPLAIRDTKTQHNRSPEGDDADFIVVDLIANPPPAHWPRWS